MLAALLAFLARLGDHSRDVRQQTPRIVHDAVLDHVNHAAGAFDLGGLIVQPDRPGAIEHFEVLQGVLCDDNQIGQEPRSDRPEFDGLACRPGDGLGAMQRRGSRNPSARTLTSRS